MIKIKRVDTTDDEVVDELIWLHSVTFGSAAPTLRDEDTYGRWWIAFDGKDPVGFAALVPAANTPRTGYLKRCGVLPSHRGLGLQRRFIRVREAFARRIGQWERMVTDTTSNIASANSLIKCGYRLFAPEHPWAWKPSETLYWEKYLRERKPNE